MMQYIPNDVAYSFWFVSFLPILWKVLLGCAYDDSAQ